MLRKTAAGTFLEQMIGMQKIVHLGNTLQEVLLGSLFSSASVSSSVKSRQNVYL
jgi:hypothetical protein